MSSRKLPYNDYGRAMRQRFGGRMQKIAIDAHLGCPHRNNNTGVGGCTFCLNDAFSPGYCREHQSITEQITQGIAFHKALNRSADIYIAYFQSGTNTLATISHLEKIYQEALSHPAISGLIIATRPDCISSEKLELISQIAKHKYVAIEYGIESIYDTTLKAVNRGHDFTTSKHAIALTKSYGIDVGAHFILGLPHESREMLLALPEAINTLGIDFIKFHQLQIYRSTPLAEEWHEHPERFLFGSDNAMEEYITLMVDIIRRLSPDIAIERLLSQAPRSYLLHSPFGGHKVDIVRNMIIERMYSLCAQQGDMIR